MQLGPPPTGLGDAPDIATALRRAGEVLGHRPLLTVLTAERRDEQSAASLAQWAAKGAHLLEADLLAEPGDVLTLDAPLGWPSVTVLLAAWWAGLTVALGSHEQPRIAIVQEGRTAPTGAEEVLWLGSMIDGGLASPTTGEPWTTACQGFPDQPPRPHAAAERPAVIAGPITHDQGALLALARSMGTEGTLGVQLADDEPTPPQRCIVEVTAAAVRPLLAGRPTVLAQGVDRSAAAGERVAAWW